MAAQFITPREIIEIKEQSPDENILTLDIDNINYGKNKTFPTSYIPFKCKRLVGPPTQINLKLHQQISSSNAKISFGVLPKDAKDVRITMIKFIIDDLENTDYPEDKKLLLIQKNNEAIKALHILKSEYEDLVNTDILTYDGEKFELGDCRNINNICQTHRKASKEEKRDDKKLPKDERLVNKMGKIPLPHALYRLKILADYETKKLGYKTKNGHKYVVFDARKANKSNKFKPVVAKVKSKGNPTDLTTDNAKHFITYMSLFSGLFNFDSICISKSGISLMGKFHDIHIWPHKPMTIKTIDEDEMAEMAYVGATGYDSDAEIDEPEEGENVVDDFEEHNESTQSRPKTKPVKTRTVSNNKSPTSVKVEDNNENEVFLDNEPEENDNDNEDEDEDEPVEDENVTTTKKKLLMSSAGKGLKCKRNNK
jgi:hypothetical protein